MEKTDRNELLQIFKVHDGDVDGKLTPEELITLLTTLDYDFSDEQFAHLETVESYDFEEFLEFLKFGFVKDEDADVLASFKHFDPENTGKLSVEVLAGILVQSNVLTEDEIDEVLRDLPVDDDKMVDYTKLFD